MPSPVHPSRRRSARGRWLTALLAAAAVALPVQLLSPAGASAAPVAAPAVTTAGAPVLSTVPARVGTPTVTGPVTGGTRGYPFFSFAQQPSPVDLAAYGYVEEEF